MGRILQNAPKVLGLIPIAEKNVYGDDLRPSSSIVPELLRTLDHFREAVKRSGMEVKPFVSWAEKRPRAAVFWDCPSMQDTDLQFCLERKVPFLLVISENMHLQPNQTYQNLKRLADRVLTYWEDEVDNQHVFWLPYGLDFETGRKFRKTVRGEGRPYLLGMISSWKKSEMPGDLYTIRNRLAIQAGKILGKRMFLGGAGWATHHVYPKKWQRSLAKRFPAFSQKMFAWPNAAYHGRVPLGDAKLSALAECEFALVPENCRSLSGYITEKIFNAIFAGCIPVYQGHPDSIRRLPPDIFIPMDQFRSGRELVRFLRAMTPQEMESYRIAGQRFLEGESAKPFQAATYAQQLTTSLKAILAIREAGKSKARPNVPYPQNFPRT